MIRLNTTFYVLLMIFTLGGIGCTKSTYYGPPGKDGLSFVKISYDKEAPDTYWDNNPHMPSGFFFNFDYRTLPGNFDFEYSFGSDIWYGSYSITFEEGGAGRPDGIPGIDGSDVYLTIFCNSWGPDFYEDRFRRTNRRLTVKDGVYILELNREGKKYTLEYRKTNNSIRSSQDSLKFQKLTGL